MHPGPINRGVEITSDVADSKASYYFRSSSKWCCYQDGCNLFISFKN